MVGCGQGGLGRVSPIGHQEVVEELAAVVGVDLQQGERQTGQDASEGIPHDQVAASQDGLPLAPPGGDVHQLEGVDVRAGGGWAGMVHQVRFDMPGLQGGAIRPAGT
jgi:hypothetical protein